MRNIPPGPWGSFVAKADTFMVKTEEHALQGVNPGGYYHATWCRDASYILRDCGSAEHDAYLEFLDCLQKSQDRQRQVQEG